MLQHKIFWLICSILVSRYSACLGLIVQSIASLIADPEVSSIPAQVGTFVEIDHEMFSTVILLHTLFQEGLLSVTSESMCTEFWFNTQSKLVQENSVVRSNNYLDIGIALTLNHKPNTKKTTINNEIIWI